MKLIKKLSSIFISKAHRQDERESYVLDTFEIQLIAEGKLQKWRKSRP